MFHRGLRVVLLLLLLLPIACAEKPATEPATETPATETRIGDVTEARVLREAASGENWLVNGGRFSGEHFSPLKRIADGNVDRLGLAWFADIPSFTLVAEPIVVDGIVYLSGSLNRVFALDAGSGGMLWQFDPEIHLEYSQGAAYGARMNRGVAVWEGRVYIGTGACTLIALDAANGTRLWESPVCDPREGWGAHVRGAPRVGGGKVYIGYSGSTSARGSLVAFDSESGAEAWRFWTVPGDPAKGFETPELERAAETWTDGWSELGGGAVWEGIRYDPVTKSVFFGTAAAGPLNPNLRGAGDALFTNSIIAVDAETGKYKWHYQTVPEGAWDYDATMPLIVVDLEYAGEREGPAPGTKEPRRVVMQAPKNGFFYVLDARTGELLAADPIVEVTWATHVDMATGRPAVAPGARFYANEIPEQPVRLVPQPGGGHNWHPMSYSPLTGLVYLPTTELAANFSARGPSQWHYEAVPPKWPSEGYGYDEKLPPDIGQLKAWDPVKREARWTVPHPSSWNGGVLSTAGNLVFQGTAGGEFRAYRADTGDLLYSRKTGTSILAGPVTFQFGDEQYVLVTAGIGGGFGIMLAPYTSTLDAQGPSRLFAFKLGGKAQMPALRDFTPVPEPPERSARFEQIGQGAELYYKHTCRLCHGKKAIGVARQMDAADSGRLHGALPDLRYMSAETHAQWPAIVLGGSRKHLGMPAFHDSMSAEDSEAIRAFVIDQAWKLYERSQH